MSGILGSLFSNKAGSYYLKKFLSPPADGNETSILKSWLQNRLREYFVRNEEGDRRTKNLDYSPILKQENLDIFSYELRVLDAKTDPTVSSPDHDECVECIVKGVQCESDDALYETGKTRLRVTFQKNGPNSSIETLHLFLNVGEVLNVELLDQIIHPFIPYSEIHSIDVFTELFPILEDWMKTRNVDIKLPVPDCYFAKYEDRRQANVEQILSTDDSGIMGKVAAGMAIDQDTPVFESHRILILEDVCQNGFTRKNATGSSFLPLFNVQAALREMCKIHTASWAFTNITGKEFTNVWPFIQLKNYVPYLLSLAHTGFPMIIHLSEEYLLKEKASDSDSIIKYLNKLHEDLPSILEKVITSAVGPLSLIHQALNFSTVLFRHSYLPREDNEQISSSKADKYANEGKSKKKGIKHRFQIKRNISPVTPSSSSKPSSSIGNDIVIKREVCIIDWKRTTFGSPMVDVAFLLLTSLPPKTLKSESKSLLQLYWDEFVKIASKFGLQNLEWTCDDLLEEYNKGLLYGCILIASNVSKDGKESVPLEDDLEIFVEAIRDLMSLNLFKEIIL